MAASQGARAAYELESVVRGHHIYKVVWAPVIGEALDLRVFFALVAITYTWVGERTDHAPACKRDRLLFTT